MMQSAICSAPLAPVRKEPAHRSEMTTQLLFGEGMEVLEQHEEWLRMRNMADGYEGWVTHHLITEVSPHILLAPVHFIAAEKLNAVQLPGGLMQVPMGSPLTGYNPVSRQLWQEAIYRGQAIDLRQQKTDAFTIEQYARLWLHAPYLWGGKSILGVDCSGFVQTVFKMAGIQLLRDAYQQAEQGLPVAVADARKGDVAFFHNEKGRVTHVGILLSSDTIIHAAGYVRIDRFDERGIWNSVNGKQTHRLNSIKRML